MLVDCVLNLEGKTTQEIDDMVSARLREGKSLYNVDEERLREAAPTLLITQNLCQVCFHCAPLALACDWSDWHIFGAQWSG